LNKILQQEKTDAVLREQLLGTRHSRFGGTFQVMKISGKKAPKEVLLPQYIVSSAIIAGKGNLEDIPTPENKATPKRKKVKKN